MKKKELNHDAQVEKVEKTDIEMQLEHYKNVVSGLKGRSTTLAAENKALEHSVEVLDNKLKDATDLYNGYRRKCFLYEQEIEKLKTEISELHTALEYEQGRWWKRIKRFFYL